MRQIKTSVFQSLDGVMQAPGGPTEDWTGGFDYGGWLPPLADEMMGEAVDEFLREPYALLLGRKTYDIFAAHWPYVTGEDAVLGEAFTRADKYVLTHQDEPLEWDNSHRLDGIEALAELKKSDGPDLLIQGSTTLYPQLLAAGLLDEIRTLTFPVVLGSGKRLFGPDTPAGTFKLTAHKVSPRGTVIATYVPVGPVETGTFMQNEPSEREQARQERMKQEG